MRGHYLRELLARLEKDARVREAAVVAYSLKLDPVAILDEPSLLKRLLRVAAHNVIQDELKRANASSS